MSTVVLEDLRFPVGRFNIQEDVPHERRGALIDSIAAAPTRLREAVRDLNDEQLDTPYREGGWTVRQVVHHVPDSHLNAYVRFRLALTEDTPTIKTYEEKEWAQLPDALRAPVSMSLDLLDALHARWVLLLRSMADADFARAFVHKEWGTAPLSKMLQLYEWHGRHHVAHITTLRSRMGW